MKADLELERFCYDQQMLLCPDFSLRDLQAYLGPGCRFRVMKSVQEAFKTALQFCNISAGDNVIVQCTNPPHVLQAILELGAVPTLVDCETNNWNMNAMTLDMALMSFLHNGKQKPKAILIAHAFGTPASMDEIQMVAERYRIPVIENAIGSWGCSYEGRKCGTLGRYGILSVGGQDDPADGYGVLVINDTQLEPVIDLHLTHDELLLDEELKGKFTLAEMEAELKRRRAVYEQYFEELKDNQIIHMRKPNMSALSMSCWYSFVRLLHNEGIEMRDSIIHILQEKGFRSYYMPKPLNLLNNYSKLPFFSCSVGNFLWYKSFFLPADVTMNKERVSEVVAVLRTVVENQG